MYDEAGEGNHRHARVFQLAQLHFFEANLVGRAEASGSKKGFDEPVFLKL